MIWIISAVAAILVLLGLISFVVQLRKGLGVTNLHDTFSWGLYIQGFFFFASVAAGILIVTAGFSLLQAGQLVSFAGTGLTVALGALVCAGLMLFVDLGKPFRFIKIILGSNFSSPMTWDFYMFGLCFLLPLVYLTKIITPGLPMIMWSVVTIGVAVVFLMVHALFFLTRSGAGFNSDPFLVLEIIIHSLWAGTAILSLIAVVLGSEAAVSLVALFTLLSMLAFAQKAGSLIAAAGSGSSGHIAGLLLPGAITVVLALTLTTGEGAALIVGLVSIVTLITVFNEKAVVIRSFQQNDAEPANHRLFDDAPAYRPSVLEWTITLGSIGLFVLITSSVLYCKGV